MPADISYTINEFCGAERISRGLLYKLWRAGLGPRYYLPERTDASPTKHESSGAASVKPPPPARRRRRDVRPHRPSRTASRLLE
jgi:hypothetical protein